MVQVNSGDTREIRANARSATTTVRVNANTNNSNNPVSTTNSMAEYYAEQARQSAETAAVIVDNAIEDIKEQENSSIQKLQNYTESSLESLEEKYEELIDTPATTEQRGLIRLATETEAISGTNNETAITPHTLKTVNNINNTVINTRIENLEQAEDSEMQEIVALVERRTENMIDLNEE